MWLWCRKTFICLMLGAAVIGAVVDSGHTETWTCAPQEPVARELARIQPWLRWGVQAGSVFPEGIVTADEPWRLPFAERKRRGLHILYNLRRRFPRSVFVHRAWYVFMRHYGTDDEFAAVRNDYARLADARPDDPLYRYMHAYSLIDRGEFDAAQQRIEQTLDHNPDMFWAHLLLARILFMRPGAPDVARIRSHLDRVIEHCPSLPEPYRYLRSVIDDPKVLRSYARHLRAVLTEQRSVWDPEIYTELWKLEFAATPVAEHETVRARIRNDLLRLRNMRQVHDFRWWTVLHEGYSHVQDVQNLQWVEDQMAHRFRDTAWALWHTVQQWMQAHPRPKPDAPPEEQRTYARTLLERTTRWIRQWPEHPYGWWIRWQVLQHLPDVDATVLIQTAESLIAAVHENPDEMKIVPPAEFQVARVFLERGIALDRIPALVEEGIRTAERMHRWSLRGPVWAEMENAALTYTRCLGRSLLVDRDLRQRAHDRVRMRLAEMDAELLQHAPDPKASEWIRNAYAMCRAMYWERYARLAEAEQRWLDALIAYGHVQTLHRAYARSVKEVPIDTVHRLWEKLGGTPEGWQAWRSLLQAGGVEKGSSPEKGLWKAVQRTIPDFELQGLDGRVWRRADLHGRVVFINVWATWCGPCRLELPYVQQLYERYRDRSDVLVLTFNVDQNTAVIAPFMEEHGYTFPVILAYGLVGRMLGGYAIPINWITDRTGTIRWEQTGFSGEGEAWLQAAIQHLDAQVRSNPDTSRVRDRNVQE